MADTAGQCRKRHNKHTGTNCQMHRIAKERRQNKQKHHSAARSDKSADKADKYTADDCLDASAFRRDRFVLRFRFIDRLQKEAQADENQCDLHGTAHCPLGQKTGGKASDHRYNEDTHKQRQAVFDIQISAFLICICTDKACQNITDQSDANRIVCRNPQEGCKHRSYYRGSTHTRKPRSNTGTGTCDKAHKYFDYNIFHHVSPFSFMFLLNFLHH